MAAVFACIVQPKVIEFNVSDQKLHRAQKDEELRLELEALKLPPSEGSGPVAVPGAPQWPTADASPPPLLCHPGGGCRLLSRSASVSVASVGSAVCVFEGALTNMESLSDDYAPLPEDRPTPKSAALSSAELMCHVYARVGVEMLGLLRGCFTFVLYESKTSRVLAARDGGGRSPLFQARTGKGSLVLSNSSRLLETSGCTADLLEVLPGEFKYGWSATPRRYTPGATHCHQPHPGGHLPHGSPHGPHSAGRSGSRRSSLDHHHHELLATSPPPASGSADSGGRYNRNHHNHHNHQQQPARGGGSVGAIGSPPPLSSPLPPHRTYVVSAEDARIVKATPGRQQQQQTAAVAAAPAAAAGAAAPAAVPSGAWAAAAPAAAAPRADKDKGQGQENGGKGRGGSARGGSSAHHHHNNNNNNKRRSLDSPPGAKQQQQQQQNGGTPPGGKQQQQQQNGGTPPGGKQQQQQSAASAGRVAKAAAPAAPVAAKVAAASSAPGASAGRGSGLRVDAPEFVCNRFVRPAAAAVPMAAAAVVSAP